MRDSETIWHGAGGPRLGNHATGVLHRRVTQIGAKAPRTFRQPAFSAAFATEGYRIQHGGHRDSIQFLPWGRRWTETSPDGIAARIETQGLRGDGKPDSMVRIRFPHYLARGQK
jgi:hypothetical protein